MTVSWPRSFIDQVRRSANAPAIIGESVALKKRGARWVGLCPFHQEKTPSFGVNDEGLWYCFGCGVGGDVFKFVMQHESLGFAEAVRSVADRAGIPVPEPVGLPAAVGTRVPRERLLALLQAATDFYVAELGRPAGERARQYLRQRGVEDWVVQRFGVGYAPESWDAVLGALRAGGFTEREAEAAGIVRRRADGSGSYDLLRDRIVFPIRDARGRTIAFGGRILDTGEPKYLNSPETPVFVKGRTLYGLDEARAHIRKVGFTILVEGYLDLLACVQHGIANVVAPLGTAFTADHARLLSGHSEKAVVAFDGDTAGQSAAERTVGTFLASGFRVSVATLPAGSDPDSFLREQGAVGFKVLLRKATPALGFLVARAAEGGDADTPRGKARALESLLAFVVEVEDRVERAEWLGRIAEALDIREDLVERALHERLATRARQHPSGGPRPPVAERLAAAPLAERDLLRAVLAQPHWLEPLLEMCGAEAILDARVAALLEAVAACHRDGVAGDSLPLQEVLARCEADGAAELLSRLTLTDDPAVEDFEYARGCALGIRRDYLRRELRRVQRQIEEVQRTGEGELEPLEQHKLQLAQAIRAV